MGKKQKTSLNQIEKVDDGYKIINHSGIYKTLAEARRVYQEQKKKKKGKSQDGKTYKSEIVKHESFRSTWEVELVELLESLSIEWVYEPERFYFHAERESYLPDFFLPEFNVWIEVKGYMDKRSERRCKLFRKYHGTETGFLLFMEEERELVIKQGRHEILVALIQEAQREQERRDRKSRGV